MSKSTPTLPFDDNHESNGRTYCPMCGTDHIDHHHEVEPHSAAELIDRLATLHQEDWRYPTLILFWLRSQPDSYRNASAMLQEIHGKRFGNHVTIKSLVDRLVDEFPMMAGIFKTTTNAYSRAHSGRARTHGKSCGKRTKVAGEPSNASEVEGGIGSFRSF